MLTYEKLQNGSDIRGIAMPGIPGEEVNLTGMICGEIARSFVLWLARKTGKKADALSIGVGRDSRLSGPILHASVLSGLLSMGAAAYDCGMASTPAMFMSTVLPGFEWDGAIMMTASHLPSNRNGLKFFTRDGGLEKADIKEILAACGDLASKNPVIPERRPHAAPLMDAYCTHLRNVILEGIQDGDTPLSGMKIAVDAGNGAGGFFATQVLEPLGADISASQYLEPDGTFPNHSPNPENKEAMASLRSAVLEGSCDLGLLFDPDVDRAGAVDAAGSELSRNRLIGLMAAIVAEQAPGSTIVTDSVTSSQLADFIEHKLGCIHHRFKRGYKNVINEGIRLNAEGSPCLLAMETSGHGAMKENYFLDDGAYLSAKIVIQLALLRRKGKQLSDLLEGLEEPADAREYRMKILDENFAAYGAEVLHRLGEYAKAQTGWEIAPNNYEGIRISVPACKGWFLLRMSLHDPLMPMNLESNLPGGADEILAQLRPFLSRCNQLDLSVLPQ